MACSAPCLRTLTGHCSCSPASLSLSRGGLTLGTTSHGHLCGKRRNEGSLLSAEAAFAFCCRSAEVTPVRGFFPPHAPCLSFLEERRSGDPPTCWSAMQWLPWAWPRGWERPRLLSPQYGPNYSSAPSLPVIVVSGSQRMLEICWSSRDLGFPSGMGLDFPLGTGFPAPIFSWGAG